MKTGSALMCGLGWEMSRAWYSLRNRSGGATPDHAQRKMLCKWFSSSLSCRGQIRGAPLCQFISLTHHILFITRIWFPKPVVFFSLKIPLTIWSWGLIFYDDGDYDYYCVQVCGEGRILSKSKTQAFKHMGCQCFCLVLALFAPHANGVTVVGLNTSGVPWSLDCRGFLTVP